MDGVFLMALAWQRLMTPHPMIAALNMAVLSLTGVARSIVDGSPRAAGITQERVSLPV
jgi:hypothetical protein